MKKTIEKDELKSILKNMEDYNILCLKLGNVEYEISKIQDQKLALLNEIKSLKNEEIELDNKLKQKYPGLLSIDIESGEIEQSGELKHS
jgi:hypothetical protein